MRAARIILFGICVGSLVGVPAAFAGAPNCGCEQPTCSTCNAQPRTCIPLCLGHRHCKCSCGEKSRGEPQRGLSRSAPPPSGPVVESYPVMRAMPMMMTMPMMPMMYGQAVAPATRAVSFDDPRSRGTEQTCGGSQNRLDDLDARVEALNLRIKTIQRAVEIQTSILQELKTQGTIGKQKPGAIPAPTAE